MMSIITSELNVAMETNEKRPSHPFHLKQLHVCHAKLRDVAK